MRASFLLSGGYTLVVTGDVPRVKGDAASVSVEIVDPPAAAVGGSGGAGSGSAVAYVAQRTTQLHMKISEARAIASAILSAATEAR